MFWSHTFYYIVTGRKVHAVNYCFKVKLTFFLEGSSIMQGRWVICSFALSSINIEYFVPILTVDTIGKVQFRMFSMD
jgi:hypothetical protein